MAYLNLFYFGQVKGKWGLKKCSLAKDVRATKITDLSVELQVIFLCAQQFAHVQNQSRAGFIEEWVLLNRMGSAVDPFW